jgi:hypothetical protein
MALHDLVLFSKKNFSISSFFAPFARILLATSRESWRRLQPLLDAQALKYPAILF